MWGRMKYEGGCAGEMGVDFCRGKGEGQDLFFLVGNLEGMDMYERSFFSVNRA